MNSIADKLAWYKNRVAAMSAAEMLYRAGQAAKRGSDFAGAHRFIAAARAVSVLPEIPGLRAGLGAWRVDDKTLRQWEGEAQRAQAGDYFLLNRQWPPCSAEQVWHMDPCSGSLWPRAAYCFSIDYRHADAAAGGRGDIKFVWELNRLQFLQPVAALACKRGDAALAQFCLDAIASWIDNNLPFLGVNWISGIELALRAVSILTVTSLVGEHASPAVRGKIHATLETHGQWIARYPSRYSSANNHRLAEGLGLFMIGALCPHIPTAASWKKAGWIILCEAAQTQILPDGAGAEQAVAYAAFALEMLLTGWHIARHTGVAVPDFYQRKLALGGEFLRWLTDKNGNQPHIGDDDNACVFGAYRRGDDYVSSVTASIAAATGRADIAPPQTQPHLRQALFGVAPASDFAPQGLRCFSHGGLSVGRHESRNGEVLLGFDHGYLGYLSIAAHGHADALAVWLHIDGQPVFIDAGTYAYHAAADSRHFFRSTAAHNTLLLEQEDSSAMAGHFNWSRQAQAVLRQAESRGDFWQIEAEHDGYHKKFQATHRRRLSVSPATGAVIEDWLTASAPHRVAISFLLHPDLTARREGDDIMVTRGERLLVRLRHESGLNTVIGAPGTPHQGFYSPAFSVRQATTRILFTGILSPEQKAATHIWWAF